LIGTTTSLCLVLLADPYRIYGSPTIEGFNARKPYPNQFQSQIKVTAALRRGADKLILGNSRAEIGLNPAVLGPNAYNLAVPGTSIQNSVAQLQDLVAAGAKPSLLVVGVEFSDFLVESNGAKRTPKWTTGHEGIKWKAESTFSLSALSDAVETVVLQHQAYPKVLTDSGLNPLLNYVPIARAAGYHALFAQRAQESLIYYRDLPRSLTYASGAVSEARDALRMLLDIASRADSKVILVIYPCHAQFMLMLEKLGLWSLFEEWKRMLVLDVEAFKTMADSGVDVRIWDFSGFAGPRCETIPPMGDTETATRWYWEAGHFKQELGMQLLERLLGEHRPNRQLLSATELTRSTLQQSRSRIAIERAECTTAYPELLE